MATPAQTNQYKYLQEQVRNELWKLVEDEARRRFVLPTRENCARVLADGLDTSRAMTLAESEQSVIADESRTIGDKVQRIADELRTINPQLSESDALIAAMKTPEGIKLSERNTELASRWQMTG